MFLVFKKEFRQFESIMSDLRKKIKNSEKMVKMHAEKNLEGYELDLIDISFDVVNHVLTVEDKKGKKIVSLNCNFDVNDILQNAKFYHFSDLLDFARKTYQKRVLDTQKIKTATNSVKTGKISDKAAAESEKRNKILENALHDLRSIKRS